MRKPCQHTKGEENTVKCVGGKNGEGQGEVWKKQEWKRVCEYIPTDGKRKVQNIRRWATKKKKIRQNSEETKPRKGEGSNLRAAAYFRVRVKNLRGDNTNWETRVRIISERKRKTKPWQVGMSKKDDELRETGTEKGEKLLPRAGEDWVQPDWWERVQSSRETSGQNSQPESTATVLPPYRFWNWIKSALSHTGASLRAFVSERHHHPRPWQIFV